MRAFDEAHKAMTGTIFTSPGIVVQLTELPGAQRLYRHKIRQNHLAYRVCKPGLQYIAATQVTLRSSNALIVWSDLKVAPALRVQQAAEDSRTIEIRQTSPVNRTVWRDQHRRVAISNDAIRINSLISSSVSVHPYPVPCSSENHVKNFSGLYIVLISMVNGIMNTSVTRILFYTAIGFCPSISRFPYNQQHSFSDTDSSLMRIAREWPIAVNFHTYVNVVHIQIVLSARVVRLVIFLPLTHDGATLITNHPQCHA